MKIDDLWGIYCPYCGSIIATSCEQDCPVCGNKLSYDLYFEDGILAEKGWSWRTDEEELQYMELGDEEEEEEDDDE